MTFEDVARKLLVRFDEILLRNCREEPARRFERITYLRNARKLPFEEISLRKLRGDCKEFLRKYQGRVFEEVPRKI